MGLTLKLPYWAASVSAARSSASSFAGRLRHARIQEGAASGRLDFCYGLAPSLDKEGCAVAPYGAPPEGFLHLVTKGSLRDFFLFGRENKRSEGCPCSRCACACSKSHIWSCISLHLSYDSPHAMQCSGSPQSGPLPRKQHSSLLRYPLYSVQH